MANQPEKALPVLPTADDPATTWLEYIHALLLEENVRDARRMADEIPQSLRSDSKIQHLITVLSPPEVRVSNRPTGPSRDREYRWLKENSEKYMGQWVAIEGDQLIAASKNLDEVYAELDTYRERHPNGSSLLHFCD